MGTKIPSLTALRKHIKKHGWNACSGNTKTLRDMFEGQCEYASTSLSEMLTGDSTSAGWSLRVRGWYCGEITAIRPSDGSSNFKPGSHGTKHAHSWVVFEGKIIDPTWWQFTDERPKVYVFDANDPRFEIDPEA
jgi:hypothetical protein